MHIFKFHLFTDIRLPFKIWRFHRNVTFDIFRSDHLVIIETRCIYIFSLVHHIHEEVTQLKIIFSLHKPLTLKAQLVTKKMLRQNYGFK